MANRFIVSETKKAFVNSFESSVYVTPFKTVLPPNEVRDFNTPWWIAISMVQMDVKEIPSSQETLYTKRSRIAAFQLQGVCTSVASPNTSLR